MVSDEGAIFMPVSFTLYKSTAKSSQIRIQGLLVLGECQRMKVSVLVERLSFGFAVGNVQIAQTKDISLRSAHRPPLLLFVRQFVMRIEATAVESPSWLTRYGFPTGNTRRLRHLCREGLSVLSVTRCETAIVADCLTED